MISLAPWRYRKISESDGGPVGRLEFSEGELNSKRCFHAVSYLSDGLIPDEVKASSFTEQPDGTGTHELFQVACHMAISEAIERWAVYYCREQGRTEDGGIGIDSSSNGFAAFPGLLKKQARKAAFQESIERHCLICWWEGLLSHHSLPDLSKGIHAISIENPLSSHSVVLIWSLGEGGTSYAFGAGKSEEIAARRASVELERIQSILKKFPKEWFRSGSGGEGDILERRVSYFSRSKGTSEFLDRIECRKPSKKIPTKLLFDAAVSGPWDKYADVWRTIIEPPSREYLGDREDYFFW